MKPRGSYVKNRLIYGVGVNDADYVTEIKQVVGRRENGRAIYELVSYCPFQRVWRGMLRRCYDINYHLTRPTYTDCSVVPEWKYFSAFKSWMEQQDWEGKDLDKDLLIPGNNVYGPDFCVFLDRKVNCFILERKTTQRDYPTGVTFERETGKYLAQCRSVVTGKVKKIGRYKTPEEAHMAWLAFKLEQAKILASEQKDLRVAKALIDRYENYNNETRNSD